MALQQQQLLHQTPYGHAVVVSNHQLNRTHTSGHSNNMRVHRSCRLRPTCLRHICPQKSPADVTSQSDKCPPAPLPPTHVPTPPHQPQLHCLMDSSLACCLHHACHSCCCYLLLLPHLRG